MSGQLPNGWASLALGDVTDDRVDQGGPSGQGSFTYVDISSVDNDAKRIVDVKRLEVVSAPSRARQRLQVGDVLVAMTRPNLNAVAQVPSELDGAVGSTGFHVLRPGDVESKWLYYAVQTTEFVNAMAALVQGALYPAVRPKDVRAYTIPVAPVAEQRRIVAALEEHLSDLDAAVGGLERARANASRYLGALIEHCVRGVASASAEGPLKPLVRVLDQGWSPKCDSVPASAGEWGVIKTTAIQPLRFQPQANKRLPVALPARPGLALHAGDLLVTRAGPRSRVGISCVVPDDQPRLMNCDKVYRAQLRLDRIRPEYVAIVLNAPSYLRRLDELKSGISDSGVNLTQDRFLDLVVPLPSLADQEALVRDVALKQSLISHTLDDIDVQLARAGRLRQAILQRAFSGRLVPQDPADEPASAFLDHLRAGRTPRPTASSHPRGRPRATPSR